MTDKQDTGHCRFEDRPLLGKKILVTRAASQAGEFSRQLLELGAEPVLCPMLEIAPPETLSEFDSALEQLAETDFLILTSVNAVEAFFNRLARLGYDAGVLAGITLVSVGPKTSAALTAYGVNPDMMPSDYRAEGIVAMLKDQVSGKKVLYPKAELARDVIPQQLAEAGAEISAPIAYRSIAPPGAAKCLEQALEAGVDLMTFSASSTVNNLMRLLNGDWQRKARTFPVASIGPLTSATARDFGLDVVVEPEESTLDAMLESIVEYYTNQQAD